MSSKRSQELREYFNIWQVIAMKEITIGAKIENLYVLLDFIQGELEKYGCPSGLHDQIALAAEEIFVNIALYAYCQDDPALNTQNEPLTSEVGAVTVRVDIGDEIIIEYEDSGIPFCPLIVSEPCTASSIEEREIGGMGIFIAKKMMDTINYKNVDNNNILQMIKKLKNM